MKKPLLLSLFLLIIPALLFAQDFEYGQFELTEINMTKYDKDTSAHAVVLKEFGKTWLSSGDDTPLIYEYHTKIKIFDKNAFDQGDISIPIYKIDNNRFEEVTDIKGITYYKDESGNVQKVELDPKKIIHVKGNRYWDEIRFAMPSLRNGCVIEYKYKLSTPRIFNFKTWNFQDEIPKIYSEYEAHIPGFYNYNVTLRGALKLSKTNAEIEYDCFTPGGGAKCDCSKITYAMNDIPAFVTEEYMTASKNFMSAIYFELSDYTNPYNGTKVKITKDWKDVDYDMKHDEQFGAQIKRTGVMKDRIEGVISGKNNELDKAKAVYAFIQKSFKWNDFIGWGSDDGIKKAFDNHSGSVADINLALIAALNAAGVNTEAVLLSTREHGIVNKLFPVEMDFNYVIAKANIGDKSYLLDATDPLLPFGLLPLKCINDQGRVMSLDKPSYWIDLAASQPKSSTYALDLTLQEDGKLKGTLANYSVGYEAYKKRKAIKKFNSVEEYVDDFDNKLKKLKINKFEIQNLDTLDAPLVEKYEIEMNALTDMSKKLTFNPLILDQIDENPFKLNERTYPIDLGSTYNDKFVLTLHLPQGYKVEPLPQNVALAMPLQGGRFMVNYDNLGSTVSFSRLIQFNKAIYSPDEYPYLKEFYNKIIQSQNGEIAFSKN